MNLILNLGIEGAEEINKRDFLALSSNKHFFKDVRKFKMLNLSNVIFIFKDPVGRIKKYFLISAFLYQNKNNAWVLDVDGKIKETTEMDFMLEENKNTLKTSIDDYLIKSYKEYDLNVDRLLVNNMLYWYIKNRKRVVKWLK